MPEGNSVFSESIRQRNVLRAYFSGAPNWTHVKNKSGTFQV